MKLIPSSMKANWTSEERVGVTSWSGLRYVERPNCKSEYEVRHSILMSLKFNPKFNQQNVSSSLI